MNIDDTKVWLSDLAGLIEGDFFQDQTTRIMYATDGSVYRELPLAVCYPKNEKDIHTLITFAHTWGVPLIPRTAGTSLAGQCVGSGIVVDVSKYMHRILEWNVAEGWVKVQPGVIRDELNFFLKPYGYFFGPNTSTANRCMIGGMVGNNSSGTTSIKYGVTRDHVLEIRGFLSNGDAVHFTALNYNDFQEKLSGDKFENELYRHIYSLLINPTNKEAIEREFPKPEIHRRNTGYAIDRLLRSEVFTPNGHPFNFCELLSGSEGTLAFFTEIKLHVNPLPPPVEAILCAHFSSLSEALEATLTVMEHQPYACELMDKFIMDCTKENIEQQKNRFFLVDDPAAILIIELRDVNPLLLENKASILINALKEKGFGYAYPLVYPPDTQKIMALRAAGFGVLSLVKGDKKPLEFVEDTAVALTDLPAYIAEFQELMRQFGQEAVYYAHAGAGELHIRPMVNLKTSAGLAEFRAIGEASARLVKKYRGSLSGEHGDGRVRGEFIPFMLGNHIYELLKGLKNTWDPKNIFNPGKIIDTPPMNVGTRYLVDVAPPEWETFLDFSDHGGILKAAEKCSGSGDCRKLPHVSGGVMCPSYMVTKNEKDTTRGRANVLREILTQTQNGALAFQRKELDEVMDLCISCKGCTSECPSNVDMSTLKAEYLYQKYKKTGIPLRAKMIANISFFNKLGSFFPVLANFLLSNNLLNKRLKRLMGVAEKRSLPFIQGDLKKWFLQNNPVPNGILKGKVFFFCDEFTRFNDVAIGKKAILLLTRLGYQVEIPAHAESGRAAISKGLLKMARRVAEKNISLLGNRVSKNQPLIGIEPSAILGFRDEYPRLVRGELKEKAEGIKKNVFLLEEFMVGEIEKGHISPADFTDRFATIKLHGHCHQKALSSQEMTAFCLNLPANYQVEVLPTGCCGMAGSFGYEKEHYHVSMKIGELILFPEMDKSDKNVIIAAPGTSCRHQIFDGTNRLAFHPAEILYDALR
jgi:FAD/FMN-containing dehydrogenase/Fe-S oxidoreductase